MDFEQTVNYLESLLREKGYSNSYTKETKIYNNKKPNRIEKVAYISSLVGEIVVTTDPTFKNTKSRFILSAGLERNDSTVNAYIGRQYHTKDIKSLVEVVSFVGKNLGHKELV